MSGLEVSPAPTPPKARAKRYRRFIVFDRSSPSGLGRLFGAATSEWKVDSVHVTLAAAKARFWELTARQVPPGLSSVFVRRTEYCVRRRDLDDPTKIT